MNIDAIAESKLIADIGWTLAHSLWQIGLVSLALLLVLHILRDREPNLRYLISVAALILAVALPFITFVQTSSDSQAQAFAASAEQHRRTSAFANEGHVGEESQNANGDAFADNGSTASSQFITSARNWVSTNIDAVLPIAVLFWFAGVGFFSLRLIGGFSHLRQYKNLASNELDECWLEKFSTLCETIGVSRTVRLLRSEIVETPIAIGILKPVIVIPASLFLQISPQELETIIAHELIHIRRFDPFVNVIQCVVESIFFYHPGVWWISSQIRREREFAADASVVATFENSHVMYARALANLEEIRLRANQQTPRYATAANGGNFMQRIERILKIKTEASKANSAWTAGVALLLTSAFLLAVFSFSSSDVVNAQQKPASRKLAIGFVSIPPLDRTANAPKDSDATARLLIQKLKEFKVPATGFLQGGMISDGDKLFPVRANIARLWTDSGFEIGLGGFKHIWLHNTPVDEYISNIEKNELVAKKITNRPLHYFSYPFLNTGRTVEDKAKVEAWLASRGYTSVKYTFDNNEWMYSYAYDMARNDNDVNTMKEIREAYIDYMGRMFDHYEAYSTEMFGRDIPQTMVLTPSRLITDTADEFFTLVSKRGYSFVTIDEAQSDAAYRTKEDFVGQSGISWFERWQMAKGRPLLKEPEIDSAIQKIWDEKKSMAKK